MFPSARILLSRLKGPHSRSSGGGGGRVSGASSSGGGKRRLSGVVGGSSSSSSGVQEKWLLKLHAARQRFVRRVMENSKDEQYEFFLSGSGIVGGGIVGGVCVGGSVIVGGVGGSDDPLSIFCLQKYNGSQRLFYLYDILIFL